MNGTPEMLKFKIYKAQILNLRISCKLPKHVPYKTLCGHIWSIFESKKGVENGSVLQLVLARPNPERNQQGNVVSPAAANLKQLSTLNRNMKECVRCAQRDTEPNQRNRYDTPEGDMPEEPCKFIPGHTLE